MNIEVANRLYQYRKNMGLSQEELAEKIGVSRQAVSKWERAEASPDTDNLIELAKVYGVTLDEMLQGNAAAEGHGTDTAADNQTDESHQTDSDKNDTWFHVTDHGDDVSIGRSGIHVSDRNGTKVSIDKNGIFVSENGEQKVFTDEDGHIHKSADVIAEESKHRSAWKKVPYPLIAVVAYLLFGYFNVCGGWSYGWIVFLTIPLYYTLIEAIERRSVVTFCYPVLATAVFLILGFTAGLWHPGWIVFLTIPIFYGICGAIKTHKKR